MLAARQRQLRDGLLPPWNARVRTVMTVAGTLCSLALWPTIA
jgi:hypothetical protein